MVLKESSRYGSIGGVPHRAAWFATLAGNSNKGGEYLAAEGGSSAGNVKGAEERRAQRRQRSGSGGAVVVGSPDLLMIPEMTELACH